MTTAQANTRITLKNILFLTDFSEPSGAALPFASRPYVRLGCACASPPAYTYMTPEMASTFLDDEEDRAKAEMQRVEGNSRGCLMKSSSNAGPACGQSYQKF
jgi:hypothetical protein